MGEFSRRKLNHTVTPTTIVEIQNLVLDAISSQTPLYSFSTGKNWGLGSKQPVVNDCVVVDLSKINQIREINKELGYAIIEAGVTQQQLYDSLEGTNWIFNYTSSSAYSSIIGNSIERGVGNIRQRTDDILGFEVVTGKGEVIKTGSFWHKKETNFYYEHGIGANLTDLFFQSNFGIVTAAIIELHPKPEQNFLIEAMFNKENMDKVMKVISEIYRNSLNSSVYKIYDRNAVKNYGFGDYDCDFILYGNIMGSEKVVALQKELFKEFLSEKNGFIANKTRFIELNIGAKLNDKSIVPVIEELYSNRPSYISLESFPSSIKKEDKQVACIENAGYEYELDKYSDTGWVMILPLIPLTSKDLYRTLAIITEIENKYQVKINTTMNILNKNCIDLVTTSRFERNQIAINTAHLVLSDLHNAFDKEGFFVYRTDIDHQSKEYLYKNDTYFQYLVAMKKCFDPHNIISPNRYIKIE
jgi:4-cresol dehydrogenase (hydroxylating)